MGFWTWAVRSTSLSYKGSSGFRDNRRVRLKIWGEVKDTNRYTYTTTSAESHLTTLRRLAKTLA